MISYHTTKFNSCVKLMSLVKLPKQFHLFILFLLLFIVQISVAGDSGNPLSIKYKFSITEGLRAPLRIAIDDQDVVYVSDAIGGIISRYDSSGNFLGDFDAGGSPLAIAVTRQHLLYVGDKVSGELQLYTVGGQLLKKISNDIGGFDLASCAVMDDENRLYVVDGRKRCVFLFDPDGNFMTAFGDSQLVFPTGIAFDRKNQRILVAEHGGLNINDSNEPVNMIHAFNKDGVWQASFGESGSEEGQFSRIQGLAVDGFGRIYAADTYQGVVTVLNEQGEYLATVGQFGVEPGELLAPMDVALDSRGRLWVASMNNGSLEVYDIGDIPTSVGIQQESEPVIPARSELLQNYPNPFNPGTWIPFVLEKDCDVVIHIYNEMGQLIRTYDLGHRKRGSYTGEGASIYWDGRNRRGEVVASGVYIYEIRSENFVAVRRMLLIK